MHTLEVIGWFGLSAVLIFMTYEALNGNLGTLNSEVGQYIGNHLSSAFS